MKPWIYASVPFVEEDALTKYKMFGEIGASVVPVEKPKEFLGKRGTRIDWRGAFFLGGGMGIVGSLKAAMGIELIEDGPVTYLSLSYRF